MYKHSFSRFALLGLLAVTVIGAGCAHHNRPSLQLQLRQRLHQRHRRAQPSLCKPHPRLFNAVKAPR